MLLTVKPSIRATGYIEAPHKGGDIFDWLCSQSTIPVLSEQPETSLVIGRQTGLRIRTHWNFTSRRLERTQDFTGTDGRIATRPLVCRDCLGKPAQGVLPFS